MADEVWRFCLNCRKTEVVRNGTYREKNGLLVQKLRCKKCGETATLRTDSFTSLFPNIRIRTHRNTLLVAFALHAIGCTLADIESRLAVKSETIRKNLTLFVQHDHDWDHVTKEMQKVFRFNRYELDEFRRHLTVLADISPTILRPECDGVMAWGIKDSAMRKRRVKAILRKLSPPRP